MAVLQVVGLRLRPVDYHRHRVAVFQVLNPAAEAEGFYRDFLAAAAVIRAAVAAIQSAAATRVVAAVN